MWVELLVDRTDRPRGSVFEVSDEVAHRMIAADQAVIVTRPRPESAAQEPSGRAMRPTARKRRRTR